MTRARWMPGLLLVAMAAAQSGPVKLKVAAVQFRSSFDIEDNRKRMISALERLAGEQVNVAVFPECALTGYHKLPEMAVTGEAILAAEESIRRVCAAKKLAVVFGSVYKINGKAYNTAVVFDSSGTLVERYGKVMLAGEQWATPGNHIAYFELEGVPSTVIICHDERYPELVRLPAIQGARVAYYISHESGMKAESKLVPYRAQIMARAVENQVFVVAANAPGNPADNSGSHGQSRIVAHDGNILKEASFYGEDVLVETLAVKPGRLERALGGLTGDWWRSGMEAMMKNRSRPLE
ncbi:MAG: carbon-nitrogen hydrolase family protein [Acidobacteria bacterium]|nr:carbon-nitrogen hydrolase family protein [Acidobacteriota bacterium]